MRRALAGPGTNKHNPVIPGSDRDVQKAAPAGPNPGGYRNKGMWTANTLRYERTNIPSHKIYLVLFTHKYLY